MTNLKRILTKTHAMAFAVVALSSTAYADSHGKGSEWDKFEEAMAGGKPYIDLRYRLERVDDAGFMKDAEANTVRAAVGYTTKKYHSLQAGIEIENVNHLGAENFNDTENNATAYPTIADPAVTEVNHAWVSTDAIPDTVITIGRQPIALGNQRFVTTAGYRQNNQSYDAATIVNTSVPYTTLLYSHIVNVNRVQGDDFATATDTGNYEGHHHVLNATFKIKDYGKLTGYAYMLDLDDTKLAASSSQTFGANFSGSYQVCDAVKAHYSIEYADQDDWGKNPNNYSASYVGGYIGLSYIGFSLTYAYESLEGNAVANKSFQAPLGDGHKYNGWADKFNTTPTSGVNDSNVKFSYHFNRVPGDFGKFLNGFKLGGAFHSFEAEHGSDNYGDELDLFIKRTFRGRYTVEINYADFQADASNRIGLNDAEKMAVTLRAKF